MIVDIVQYKIATILQIPMTQNQSSSFALSNIAYYLCPCFRKSSTTQIIAMHNQTQNTLPKEQPSTPHNHTLIHQHVPSGIYIDLGDDNSHPEQQDNIQMQKEYETYLHKSKVIQQPTNPILQLPQHKLFLIGNHKGRLLAKINNIVVTPSPLSIKKHRQAQKTNEKIDNPVIERYWQKRYYLFERFDQGIKLDEQSWFSVTPEAISEHIASKFEGCENVLDGFCGAGGDSIKLGMSCKNVYCNDIDPIKIQLLLNNAAIYGVQNITTINQDYFALHFPNTPLDAVYLSPPWGGPDYFKIERMQPQDFIPSLQSILEKTLQLSQNFVLLLPKNTDIQSLAVLLYATLQKYNKNNTSSVLFQKIYFQGKFKLIVLLVGNKVNSIKLSDQLEYIYKLLKEDNVFGHKRVVKKMREQYGVCYVLNSIVESEKIKKKRSAYEKWVQYLISNGKISKQKLQKLQLLQQSDNQDHVTKPSKIRQKNLNKSKKKEEEGGQNSQIMFSSAGKEGEERGRIEVTNSFVSSYTVSRVDQKSDVARQSSFGYNDSVIIQNLRSQEVQPESKPNKALNTYNSDLHKSTK